MNPRPRPASSSGSDVSITLKDALRIVRQHMVLIISLTILGLIGGGAAWYLLLRYAPKYTARTYLEVLPPVDQDPTKITNPLVNEDIQYAHRTSIAALAQQQSQLEALLRVDRIQETRWFRQFGDINKNKAECLQKAFEELEDNFRAHPQRDSQFVSVSMTCGFKEESALILNELMRLFLSEHGAKRKGEIRSELAGLRQQQRKVQGQLDEAERALDQIRENYKLTDLEEDRGNIQHTITIKLQNLELMRDEFLLQMRELRGQIREYGELATGPITIQTERAIETDAVMTELANRIAVTKARLAGLLAKFGEGHRAVQQTRDLIRKLKDNRQERKLEIAEQNRQANLKDAQTRFAVFGERLAQLNQMVEEARAEKKRLDLARVEYRKRVAIRDERQGMLAEIKDQIDRLEIMTESPKTTQVQLTGQAPEPKEVSSPKWQFFFPGGTFLGLLAGVGFAFLLELTNDLLRTPRDVIRFLDIPLLGVIPDADEDETAEDVNLYHVVREAPYSVITESYRRLRTHLKTANTDKPLNVLCVSSGMPGEGKTSVAANLASTLLVEGKKVLLIDANFRRPSLQKVFTDSEYTESEDERVEQDSVGPLKSRFGLSNILTEQCSYGEAIRSNVLNGLDVIEAGPMSPNPAVLLESPRMNQLVKEQRKHYDYIIIDTPPSLLVSDTKVLAGVSDGNLLVFNANTTSRGAAQRVIRELREVEAEIFGCVLFAAHSIKGGYFREQFRSYREYQQNMQPVNS